MKLSLIQASKAFGVFNALGDQVLPGRMAKAIHDNHKMLKDHVQFLVEEENKAIAHYHAKNRQGMGYYVPDNEALNAEFIAHVRELQEMQIELNPVMIDEEMLLSYAHLAPNDLEYIGEFFIKTNEEGENHDEHADV